MGHENDSSSPNEDIDKHGYAIPAYRTQSEIENQINEDDNDTHNVGKKQRKVTDFGEDV